MFLMIYYNGYGYNFYYGNYGYYEYSVHPEPESDTEGLVMFLVMCGSVCLFCSPCIYIRCAACWQDKDEA